jgi:hypothetical protein
MKNTGDFSYDGMVAICKLLYHAFAKHLTDFF